MDSIPFWKKINQTVCGYSRAVTEEIVSEILVLSKKEITDGLLIYKEYSKEGYADWAKSSVVNTDIKDFVMDLSLYLKLDAKLTHLVMCNYLMYEYYGKIKEFWHIMKRGTTMRLKESIWNFYTSERMFMLKTLRHILEYSEYEYDFTEQYKRFLKSINIGDLQTNLIKQFEMLMGEITSDTADVEDTNFERWLCRNHREQTELLLILVLTASRQKLDVKQLSTILTYFVQHNFNTAPCFFETVKISDPKDINDLICAEIGCFFAVLEKYWDEEDLTSFWQHQSIKNIMSSLSHSFHKSKYSSVSLAWFVFKVKSTASQGKEEKLVTAILSTSPLDSLHTVITNPIFKNCRAGDVVVKSVYRMVDEFSFLYADLKLLYEEKGLMPLVITFLSYEELLKQLLLKRGGLDTMLEIAIETFPLDFFSFTRMCKTLLAHPDHYKETIRTLNDVPSFLSNTKWDSPPQEEILKLDRPVPMYPDSDRLIIPARTVVNAYQIFRDVYLQYKCRYNYLSHLEYMVTTLVENSLVKHEIDKTLLTKVITGYEVVVQAIKCCKDADLQLVGLQQAIEKVDRFLPRLNNALIHSDLVQLYFDIHNALMVYRGISFFSSCPQMVWRLFFPRIRGDCIDKPSQFILFNHEIFEETVLYKIFQQEEFRSDHKLLLTYLDILYNTIKVDVDCNNFLKSGVVYFLNFVFLQHQTWTYDDENERSMTTLTCLSIIHYILQWNNTDMNASQKNIFTLCQDAFLRNACIIESFLRLFITEKYHLTFVMERESNWLNGPALNRLKCIQMQLALLLIVLKCKEETNEQCVLDKKLTSIVKPVASYFTNAYSPVIAELSCRFLEKLAQRKEIPLLALLELDHYQVQSLFLEKLRDPLEDEHVKVAIIDLINTCIANQNGMTAAFFNLKCFMYWDGMESDLFSGDTVSDFMVDYLQNIKTSHEFFKSPLQLGILKLLHNLWLNHRENLIDNIAKLKDFWPIMMDPFFCSFVQDIDIYCAILRIVNLEIGANAENVDIKLTNIIAKFFADKEQLKLWIAFMHNKTKDPYCSGNDELLSSWMEFLIVTKKVMADKFDSDTKRLLVISCLDGLNYPFTTATERGSNTKIVYLWTQIYLMLISSWSIYSNQEELVLNKLSQFLSAVHVIYPNLPLQLKEIILCTINKTIIDLNYYFTFNLESLTRFLNPVGVLIDLEHENLIGRVWKTKDDAEKVALLKPWLVIIFICNSLFALENVKEIELWLHCRKLLQRIMDSVGPMLLKRSTLPFAKLAINHLITYAESPLTSNFSSVNLGIFYYRINSPGLTISIGEAIQSGLPVNLKEWWLIFIVLIRLNRTLINKLGSSMLDTCFSFMAQHDQPLKEIICLTKFTVDMTALTLVCETLKFIYTMLDWKDYWRSQSKHSYDLIIDGIKTTINACILSLLGSKKINFYNIIDGKHLDVINDTPTDLLASVLNKLIEIIYWSTSCLSKTKPRLIDMLDTQMPKEPLRLLVDNDFSVPRFELPIASNLTYGKLLCLAHYLCKTLNQLSPTTPTVIQRSRQVSMTELNEQIKIKSLEQIFEHCTATYEKYIGFMVYIQRSDDMPNEKLSSFLHYDMSEYSRTTTSAISQLSYQVVKNGLESLMVFLAGEILVTTKSLDEEALYNYKRELCSEIQFFYEFVRKRTIEQFNSIIVPSRTLTILQNETDVIKRYMVAMMQTNINNVADSNFELVLAQWFVQFCGLSN